VRAGRGAGPRDGPALARAGRRKEARLGCSWCWAKNGEKEKDKKKSLYIFLKLRTLIKFNPKQTRLTLKQKIICSSMNAPNKFLTLILIFNLHKNYYLAYVKCTEN
jgi:hypothetical protein